MDFLTSLDILFRFIWSEVLFTTQTGTDHARRWVYACESPTMGWYPRRIVVRNVHEPTEFDTAYVTIDDDEDDPAFALVLVYPIQQWSRDDLLTELHTEHMVACTPDAPQPHCPFCAWAVAEQE